MRIVISPYGIISIIFIIIKFISILDDPEILVPNLLLFEALVAFFLWLRVCLGLSFSSNLRDALHLRLLESGLARDESGCLLYNLKEILFRRTLSFLGLLGSRGTRL